MIKNLRITNFKNLRRFDLQGLGRVNLFSGKNNCGKSNLLEALAIYCNAGDLDSINQIIRERGEFHRKSNQDADILESNLLTYSSLFTDRVIDYNYDDAIVIGPIEENLFEGDQFQNSEALVLRFIRYRYAFEETGDEPGRLVTRRRKRVLVTNEQEEARTALEIIAGFSSSFIPLDEEIPRNSPRTERMTLRLNEGGLAARSVQYIRTKNIDREINELLWDKITLTPKEKYLEKALAIINPSVERLAFVASTESAYGSRFRIPVVKVKGDSSVYSLRSMGDGMNRILSIVLALINSDRGVLIIDEFDNGLHFSVQKALWKMVFELAETLDVQVFSTTHSNDCIRAFYEATEERSTFDGAYFRLERELNDDVRLVAYSPYELGVAVNRGIELR